jgi:hypothetical protein
VTTVKDMWAKKNKYTNDASSISRTLCLSGLAVIWIFRTPTLNGSTLAPWLIWAAGLIVVALLVDLLQYVAGAVRTAKVARTRELELSKEGMPADTPVNYPESHPRPMDMLWNLKMLLVLAAWSILVVFVFVKAITASLPGIAH